MGIPYVYYIGELYTMRLIILIMLLCNISYTQTKKIEKWSAESATLFTTLQSMSALDARQAFHMEEYRMYYDDLEPITYAHEANPLIGESPTQDRIIMVKLLSGGLTYYLLNKMKEKNRKKALIGFNVFYFIVVLHNASLGLRI